MPEQATGTPAPVDVFNATRQPLPQTANELEALFSSDGRAFHGLLDPCDTRL